MENFGGNFGGNLWWCKTWGKLASLGQEGALELRVSVIAHCDVTYIGVVILHFCLSHKQHKQNTEHLTLERYIRLLAVIRLRWQLTVPESAQFMPPWHVCRFSTRATLRHHYAG